MRQSLRQRWQALYHRSSIQFVLSLSFTAVAIVGMVFMGLALFLRFSATSNALAAESSKQVLSQVNRNLDHYLRSMMRVSNTAYYQVIKDLDLAAEGIWMQRWTCCMKTTGTLWCPSLCSPKRGI